MIPGTPQPDEISKGMKLFPDNPNLRKILSMINATRAIYPQSSRKLKNRNTIAICGTNPIGAPIPAMMPSHTSDLTQSEAPSTSIRLCAPPVIHSPKRTSFVQSVTTVPTVVTAI